MRSGQSKRSTLQMKLIKSLEDLIHDPRELQDHQIRLHRVISALHNTQILHNDYATVFAFSYLLINEIPDVLKSPKNLALRDLANHCRLQQEESLRKKNRVNSKSRS